MPAVCHLLWLKSQVKLLSLSISGLQRLHRKAYWISSQSLAYKRMSQSSLCGRIINLQTLASCSCVRQQFPLFPSVTSMLLLCLLSCQWHHRCFLRWRLFLHSAGLAGRRGREALGIWRHASLFPAVVTLGSASMNGLMANRNAIYVVPSRAKKILRTATVAEARFSARAVCIGGWLRSTSHQRLNQQAVQFDGVPERAWERAFYCGCVLLLLPWRGALSSRCLDLGSK